MTWIFKQEHWLPLPYNLQSTCANKLWERYMSDPGYQENQENTSSFVRFTPRHAKICTVHMIQPRIKCSSFWGWSVGQITSSLIAVELRWDLLSFVFYITCKYAHVNLRLRWWEWNSISLKCTFFFKIYNFLLTCDYPWAQRKISPHEITIFRNSWNKNVICFTTCNDSYIDKEFSKR